MQIDTDILISWGATSKKYRKNEIIFMEGETPRYYYQVVTGRVKMLNTSSDTKELTLGVFSAGESFAEPPIFINEKYPAKAIATNDTVIIRILKERFLQLLDEYPELQKKFLKLFSQRIYSKVLLSKNLANSSPEERIKIFLTQYKKKYAIGSEKKMVHFTRQEIANFTGLRVETVIRTLTKMKNKNIVSIVNKKLYC
ncbi:MAG: Crp/Fnr family transcriptional regulator [Niabella sp.]